MQNPLAVDGSVGEWVEVYNGSGQPVDLTDLTFEDRNGTVLMTNNPLLDPATDPTLSQSDFQLLRRIR